MKFFLLALNAVLLLAVGVLFYLYFADKNKGRNKEKILLDASAPGSFRIAYFEMDSLENKCDYLKEVRTALRKKDEDMSRVLMDMQNKYGKKVQEYQQKGPTLSQEEQVAFEQELVKMRENFQIRQQEIVQEMQAESMRKLGDARQKIQDFLKIYSKEKGYVFVYSSTDNDYLYYKDTTRNITSDLIKQLNEKYLIKKDKK